MQSELEALFHEAEKRYLKSNELALLDQYVESLPQRLEAYQLLRDQEIPIMQRVADQLQASLSGEDTTKLERSIKNALLVMRSCAMAMLLNDDNLLRERALSWVQQSSQAYDSQKIDTALYGFLEQELTQVLTLPQIELLNPHLEQVKAALLNAENATPVTTANLF